MKSAYHRSLRRSVDRVRRSFRPVYALGVRTDFEIFSFLNRMLVQEAGDGLEANHRTRLSRETWLGKDCSFNGLKVLGNGRVTIGDGFRSGPDCLIVTSNHNYHGESLPYDDSSNVEPVTIGNYVWIGARVVILPGVRLGDGCIIQTGSVVVSDIPPLAIAGGHPARIFGERDQSHWDKIVVLAEQRD